MKISNMADTQLPVQIKGPHDDLDVVVLQPKGTVDLPDGFVVVEPKTRSLFIHPEPVVVTVGKGQKAQPTEGDAA